MDQADSPGCAADPRSLCPEDRARLGAPDGLGPAVHGAPGEPECNGIMERWIRTREECLYLHDFASLDEARLVIGEFIERYNREWLLERHGHRTPAEVRRRLTRQAAC